MAGDVPQVDPMPLCSSIRCFFAFFVLFMMCAFQYSLVSSVTPRYLNTGTTSMSCPFIVSGTVKVGGSTPSLR
jgi:hypothetical protein